MAPRLVAQRLPILARMGAANAIGSDKPAFFPLGRQWRISRSSLRQRGFTAPIQTTSVRLLLLSMGYILFPEARVKLRLALLARANGTRILTPASWALWGGLPGQPAVENRTRVGTGPPGPSTFPNTMRRGAVSQH